MSNVDPNSLFSASMRNATFTTSPITVYSLRSADPTLPMMAGPACKAMPIRVGAMRPLEMRPSSSSMILTRGGQSICGVGAGVRQRGAEHGEEPVAEKLVYDAVVLVDGLYHES